MWQHAVLALCVAGILAPFSFYAGQAARALRLPQITGFLLSGIVCGPHVLGILTRESVTDLNIIEGACLSVIGLAAGAELDLPSLARSRKQVLGITAGICVVSWLLCYEAFAWVGQYYSVLPDPVSGGHRTAVATLGATLMMTRSPASAIAVLKEVDGKGPFSTLVMAVVVVKDVVVIMAYALNMEIIRAVILPADQAAGLQLINMVLPFLAVLLSMSLGVFSGLGLGVLLRTRLPPIPILPTSAGSDVLATPRPQVRYKMGVILVMASLTFQVAHYFDAEPLLACVTMGMVVANRRAGNDPVRDGSSGKDKEEVLSLVTFIMNYTNVAFFGLAGASLKLSAMKSMVVPALVVVVVRIGAIYVGSWLGCTATATTPEHRKLFWASMVTQAGVALGLARLAGTRFPDWGPHFQTFMVAIIVFNLLIGPPLFRWSLINAGEARPGNAGSRAPGLPVAGIGGPKSSPQVEAVGRVVRTDSADRLPAEAKAQHTQ